jgi:small subunit ribosomal protein S15
MPSKKTTKVVKDVSFKRHDEDTWSPEFQIGLLTWEISQLQWHLASHIHDFDAKRSLLKKVARRRRFLKYLKTTNIEIYTKVSKELWLKV